MPLAGLHDEKKRRLLGMADLWRRAYTVSLLEISRWFCRPALSEGTGGTLKQAKCCSPNAARLPHKVDYRVWGEGLPKASDERVLCRMKIVGARR